MLQLKFMPKPDAPYPAVADDNAFFAKFIGSSFLSMRWELERIIQNSLFDFGCYPIANAGGRRDFSRRPSRPSSLIACLIS